MSQHSVASNHLAYIGLGSNMAEPAAQVRRARDELMRLPSSHLLAFSSLYRTAPVGRLDQPDFINAVALIETGLTPHELLKALLEIEHRHGRVREHRNGPRTLDLDILMYDDLQCSERHLTLPHPRDIAANLSLTARSATAAHHGAAPVAVPLPPAIPH